MRSREGEWDEEPRGWWDDLWRAFSMRTCFFPLFPTRRAFFARYARQRLPRWECSNRACLASQLSNLLEKLTMHIRGWPWRIKLPNFTCGKPHHEEQKRPFVLSIIYSSFPKKEKYESCSSKDSTSSVSVY
jgi:hypothetical protein